MLRTTFLLALALALVAPCGASGEGPAPDASIAYRFENEQFLISRIDMRLDGSGTGSLVFVRKGLARPVERKVRVGEGTMAEVWASLERLDFTRSGEAYESKGLHTNLGTITIAVARDGAAREVSFHYTTNREMVSVAATLRGIANREIHAFDLETALRFQPLETPALLEALKKDVAARRIADAAALVPLLRQIADDEALPLIARNRASELAEKIEKTGTKR